MNDEICMHSYLSHAYICLGIFSAHTVTEKADAVEDTRFCLEMMGETRDAIMPILSSE